MAESKDVAKQIRKATRRKFSADEKVRIVPEGLRGETAHIVVVTVKLLGHDAPLVFNQDSKGLNVTFPTEKPCDFAYTLRITGLLNATAVSCIQRRCEFQMDPLDMNVSDQVLS